MSIQCGFQLGGLIEPLLRSTHVFSSPTTAQQRLTSWLGRWTMLTIGPLTWIGSIFLFFYGPRRWRGPVTYSMIISPLGTLARYHLAKLNTLPISTKTGFPLGTFLANIIATALLSVFTLLQLLSHDPELCGGLQGLKDGFCGCLSTISTFFVELRKIKPISRAVRYGLVSWISGQLLCVLLLGVYLWSHPLVRDQCQFPT